MAEDDRKRREQIMGQGGQHLPPPLFRPPLGLQGGAEGLAHFFKGVAQGGQLPGSAHLAQGEVQVRPLHPGRPLHQGGHRRGDPLFEAPAEPVGKEAEGDKGSGHRQNENRRRQGRVVGLQERDLVAEHQHPHQATLSVDQGNIPVNLSVPSFRRVQFSNPLFRLRVFRRGEGSVAFPSPQGQDPVSDAFGRDFPFQQGAVVGIEQLCTRLLRKLDNGWHLFFVIVGGPKKWQGCQGEQEPDQGGGQGAPQDDGQGQADELMAKGRRGGHFSQRYPIPQTVVMGFSPGSTAASFARIFLMCSVTVALLPSPKPQTFS